MDWVTARHKAYHSKTEGKCPYCQKALPEDFEDQLATCYDNQYKDDLAALGKFMDGYTRT
jgi:wobble nucleotide-excising tRNase